MKKVVYLCPFPLTAFIERFLFLRDVIEAGFDVEYWDLSGIYYKGLPFQNVLAREYVCQIQSLAEVKRRIGKEDRKATVFIAQTKFNWQTLSLFYMLTCLKCRIGYFALTVLPLKGSAQKMMGKIRGVISLGAFRKVFLNLFAKACRSLGLIKHYDMVFAPGRLTKEEYCKHSRVVDINYLDYDRYLASRDPAQRLVGGKYCVFLDEGAIANEDHKIVNNQSLNAAAFYRKLNLFFDHVEKKFNVKVVIAAHPGVFYDKTVFPDKEVYEGKTCELVRDGEFVISQASMAVSFAVLYKKPVVFIYTDEYIQKRPAHWQGVCFFAGLLGRPAVDISTPDAYSIEQIIPVDPAAYDDFKDTLLSSKESGLKSSKEIVIQELANF